ncbi:MAG: FlgD immunoglobulin-like domain containing protein [bacterium]
MLSTLKPHLAAAIALGLALILASPALAFVPSGRSERATPADDGLATQAAPPSEEAAGAWQAFRLRHGEGYTAQWNPVTGTPHRVQGKGLRIAERVSAANIGPLVEDFVRANADLLGAYPSELRLLSQERHGGRWYTDYQQTYNGLDVVGGRVHVRVKDDGSLTAFGSDFHSAVAVSTSPAISEASAAVVVKDAVGFDESTDSVVSTRLVVLPVARGAQADYYLAYEVALKIERDPAGRREPAVWRMWVNADTGDVLKRVNEIRFDAISGAVSGYIKPMYITDTDAQEAFAAHYVTVTGYGSDTTDTGGLYSIESGAGGGREVTAAIRGLWASVTNNGGAEAAFADSVSPGTQLDITWSSANSIASERNAYYHIWVSHEKIKQIDPGFTGMDRQTPIHVNEPNYCNGYWDGNLILLGAGYGSCLDLAMFADVIYHEYGHGVTDKQYGALSPSGAMHEAFSDYFACTISDESYIGEGIAGPGSYFRNCENTLRYPDDLTGEVHDDGRILVGALWDLRQALSPDVHLVDSLFHYARYAKADNFLDYYYDLLETDDDDGNLANGTPHFTEIAEAFGAHGIGPGLYIDIAHDALHDVEDSVASFTAVAAIASNITLDADSLVLYYSTGGGFTAIAMSPTANPDEYSAAIPGQAYGATVSYYIYARADGRPDYATDPEGAPTNVHAFSIQADNQPPVVAHVPLEDQPDAGWPPTVTATATDNLGLASVMLECRKNGEEQAPVAMTNVAGTDQYQAAFAVAASAGDAIEYRIVATDASAARNAAIEPASSYNLFGVSESDAFTFEIGAEGWTHSAQSGWTDQWHVSTTRNHTSGGGQSWKCGDTGTGSYANRVSALLETPWVAIGEDAALSFWYWIDAESYEPVTGSGLAWDGAALSLVDSAGKATPLDPAGGYPYAILPDSDAPFNAGKPVYSGHQGWTQAVFDLSHYQGLGKIRFKFGSDAAVGFEGLYIDDVMIWSQGALAGVGPCDDTCPDTGVPVAFGLGRPLPNPSARGMTISYAVASPGSRVAVRVFDVRGRLAATVVDENKLPGTYSAAWDGRDEAGRQVAAGIYFVRMEAGQFKAASKLVVAR